MGTFIRGLWGDAEISKWPKSLADVATTAINKHHPTYIHTYVYGKTNSHYLSWLRVEHKTISLSPVNNWGSTDERKASKRGREKHWGDVNWGVSIWRHKLEIIKQGLIDYGEVVWLDWDCWQMSEMPEDFWTLISSGQPLQASMLHFTRPRLTWREGEATKFMPHGAFIYCRDIAIIAELLTLSNKYPDCYDEVLMARWIENRWGRPWQLGDEDRWIAEGYEPFMNCYKTKHQVRLSKRPIFREGCR